MFRIVLALALLLTPSAVAATIVGTAKNDVLRGTARADLLNGKAGNDKLYGLAGNDTLVGGPGNDTLVGGPGADTLRCGPGRDLALADANDRISSDCETVRGAMLPSISIDDASVVEGNSGTTQLSFQLTLSRPVTWDVSVAYATMDGTARAGSDYVAAQATVAFAPGETTKTISMEVNGDTLVEPDETFTVTLSRPANATIPRPGDSATGTINTDDYEWHRLNADRQNVAPEHERLQCSEGATWTCSYDKLPEPALNFQWNDQKGTFTGAAVPRDQWACPAWFPSPVCGNVDRVAQGTGTYGPVQVFSIPEELIVTTISSRVQLYVYWVGQWVCPWYPTFDEALAANPFPHPFNGSDWPTQDCRFPPG